MESVGLLNYMSIQLPPERYYQQENDCTCAKCGEDFTESQGQYTDTVDAIINNDSRYYDEWLCHECISEESEVN